MDGLLLLLDNIEVMLEVLHLRHKLLYDMLKYGLWLWWIGLHVKLHLIALHYIYASTKGVEGIFKGVKYKGTWKTSCGLALRPPFFSLRASVSTGVASSHSGARLRFYE